MPAPAVGAVTHAIQTSGSTVTVNKPTGVVSGDVVVLTVYSNSPPSASMSCTGFTNQVQRGVDVAQDVYVAILTRLCDGSEGSSFTVDSKGSSSNYINITAVRVTGSSGVVNATASGDSGGSFIGTFTIPSITTTVADTLVIANFGLWTDPITAHTGWTLITPNEQWHNTLYRTLSTAQTLSSTSLSSSDTDLWACGVIALAPAGTSYDRTATGSGAGTQSATGVLEKLRTATGSGTGTQSATGVREALRTATGSGTGTETATGSISSGTVDRTATGSGTGSETALVLAEMFRTATGSGTGSATVVAARDLSVTASGSGASSHAVVHDRVLYVTAASTGQGSSTAVGVMNASRTATGAGTSGQYAQAQQIIRVRLRPTFTVGKQLYTKPAAPAQRSRTGRLSGGT